MQNKFSGPFITGFLFLSIFYSCKHRVPVDEITLKGLTVRLSQLPPSGDGDDSYGARIEPDKALAKTISRDMQTGLMYRMDSCFYLQAGQKKIYADLVQPVANGLKGTYEYLVTFQKEKTPVRAYRLVYRDKYLNKAEYVFSPR